MLSSKSDLCCRSFCYTVMPLVIKRLPSTSALSLANLVFAIGTLRLKLAHGDLEVVGLNLCSKMSFANGRQLGSICIGVPTVPGWNYGRKRALKYAISTQCQRLCAADAMWTQDVRVPLDLFYLQLIAESRCTSVLASI